MGLVDIFADAVRYPFSDIAKFLFVGVLALLASLSSVVSSFGIDNVIVSSIAAVISFVFILMLSGYCIGVIRRGIEHSRRVPLIDPVTNIIDGIKSFIIAIVYFIVPIIITAALAMLTGVAGYELNHLFAALGLAGVLAMIVFVLFAIFEVIALARFANTGNISAAFNIGGVLADVQKIKFLNILLFLIISLVIMFIASLIAAAVSFIPYVGVIIATILIGAFVSLFYYRALGLLYSYA